MGKVLRNSGKIYFTRHAILQALLRQHTCAYDEFDVDNDITKLMNGKTLFAFSGFWHAADQFLGLGGDFNIDRFEEKSKVHTQEKRHFLDKKNHLYWTSF